MNSISIMHRIYMKRRKRRNRLLIEWETLLKTIKEMRIILIGKEIEIRFLRDIYPRRDCIKKEFLTLLLYLIFNKDKNQDNTKSRKKFLEENINKITTFKEKDKTMIWETTIKGKELMFLIDKVEPFLWSSISWIDLTFLTILLKYMSPWRRK